MIYSLTGEWGNSPVGQHASKEDFHSSINYWLESKNIPKHKLVPGVPFHGVLFESRTDPMAGATSVPYSKIVVDYPNDYRKDEISIAGDKVLYLNGIPTIKYKAEYIRDHHLGGIMIWELADDTKDESKSLLKAIDDVIRR
jgi:GH18 family chitinase